MNTSKAWASRRVWRRVAGEIIYLNNVIMAVVTHSTPSRQVIMDSNYNITIIIRLVRCNSGQDERKIYF